MAYSREKPNIDSALDMLLSGGSTAFYEHFRQRSYLKFILLGIAGCVGVLFVVYAFWWQAPRTFPTGGFVAVTEGMTLTDVSKMLAKQNVIRSEFWFKAWSRVLGGDTGIKAGEYYLASPLSVFQTAKRFVRGIQNLIPSRVTIPEGLGNKEVASILAKSLKKFDRKRFLELAKDKEGYLFPDTYSFLPSATAEEVIAQMERNFEKRIEPLRADIEAVSRTQKTSLKGIITIASLIEGEARLSETRRQVSGILWHRLDLGMPLQVDAVFPYILGRDTYEVTTDDLKYDSPYNTYLYAGLPPGPINNPSLDSIKAALEPTKTKYLYYLTDDEGQMHYATSHDQHLINRARYLGK